MSPYPDIDRLKTTLDQHRPLDPAIVANLRENLIVRWTYHPNAIEGNTPEYYAALDQDHAHGNPEPFVALIADIVRESFEPYWHALGIRPDPES